MCLKPLKVSVDWDTDGRSLKACGLSRRVVVPVEVLSEIVESAEDAHYSFDPDTLTATLDGDYIADEIGDYLSDEYGFCHFGWNVV